jgi:hypothetical protein
LPRQLERGVQLLIGEIATSQDPWLAALLTRNSSVHPLRSLRS